MNPINPLENVLKEAKRKQAIGSFSQLKNKFEDRIPSAEEIKELQKSPDKLDKFKCSQAFWSRLWNGANFVKDIVDEEGKAECLEIMKLKESLNKKFEQGGYASEEEVGEANKFLNFVLPKLDKK